jgi:hypothetical protein
LIGAFLVTAIIIGMAAMWKPPERKGNLVFVREKRGRKYVTVAKFKETATQQAKGSAAADGDSEEKSDASSATAVTNIAALVSRPGWTLDLQTAQIPDATASGQISGGAFAVERALLQRIGNGYLLILRQPAAPPIDRELMISLPLKPGEKLDGNSWNVTQSPTGSAPRISKRWMQDARQQIKTFTNGYAMKLEFAQTETNTLPGKLFIALPDDEKSYVAGTLRASFLAVAAPAPTPQQPAAQRPQQSMTQRAQQAQRPPQQQQQQGQRPRPPY